MLKLFHDRLFLAALAAALPVWLIMYAWFKPAIELGWPLRVPLAFIVPVLIYPVLEELVFRGYIQDMFHRRLKPWHLGPLSHANLLTSVLFTGLHFINHPPQWAAVVLLPSLVFGYFKDRTGSLAAPITLHVFYNAGYLWLFAAPP